MPLQVKINCKKKLPNEWCSKEEWEAYFKDNTEELLQRFIDDFRDLINEIGDPAEIITLEWKND